MKISLEFDLRPVIATIITVVMCLGFLFLLVYFQGIVIFMLILLIFLLEFVVVWGIYDIWCLIFDDEPG